MQEGAPFTITEMLSAAKAAVRSAARVAASVSRGGAVGSVSKADSSPVTVADYAAQGAVTLTLLLALHGASATRALLSGGGVPPSFRMVAEEDAGELARGGEGLLRAVAAALGGAAHAKSAFADSPQAAEWSADDVLRVLSAAGGCEGGLAAERAGGGAPGYWVLDPIDGTKGYMRGGQFAVGLAFVRDGAPQFCAIACPALPHPAWREGDGGGGGAEAAVGTLFSAVAGGGAFMEKLHPVAGDDAGPAPIRVDAEAPRGLTLCESFDPVHSSHEASARVAAAVAAALGTPAWASTIQVDSMCKYGLLARGCGHVYTRIPRKGYVEKVWDHVPGALLLREAGGVVTDGRGGALDFSQGRTLKGNHEVIVGACSQRVHAAVLAALAAGGEAQ